MMMGRSGGRKFTMRQEKRLGRRGIRGSWSGARSHDSVVVISIERSDRHSLAANRNVRAVMGIEVGEVCDWLAGASPLCSEAFT